jgi:hypothetical protein
MGRLVVSFFAVSSGTVDQIPHVIFVDPLSRELIDAADAAADNVPKTTPEYQPGSAHGRVEIVRAYLIDEVGGAFPISGRLPGQSAGARPSTAGQESAMAFVITYSC